MWTRVLPIDDDPHIRELVTVVLEEEGYDVHTATGGMVGLSMADAEAPNVVLLDLEMPGMNGIDLCRRLKGDPATRLIHVVLITGVGDEHKVEGIEAGADAFLGKRFSREERAVLGRHPGVGEEICKPLHSLRTVLPIIRHHHEKMDGSGYPDGLRGEAIPLRARILQVVDIYDALTTTRPYRQSLLRAVALEILEEEEARRGWWDGRIVQAFRDMPDGVR